MPDRDVFDRNVRSGWRTASRLALGRGEAPEVLAAITRALGREIRLCGCPGFDKIVDIVRDAIRSPARETARQLADARLDVLKRQELNKATEIAVASARRLLVGNPELEQHWGAISDELLGEEIATLVLTEFAASYMFPAALLGDYVEGGEVSFQEIHARRERTKRMIAANLETRRTAAQLLSDPSGDAVRIPRTPRVKPSQAEILVVALTK